MNKKNNSLLKRFVLASGIVLTIVVLLVSLLIFNRYKIILTDNLKNEQLLLTKAQDNKTEILLNMLTKISPEAIMGLDMYSLKLFATEAMKDPEMVMLQIYNKDSKLLIDEKKGDNSEAIYLERTVKTDKAKLGIELEVGKIKIGLSTENLNKAKILSTQKASSILSNVIKSLILISLLVNILLAVTITIILKRVVIKPLLNISKRVADIAEGDGDLTARIQVKEENEIGELAHYFNGFLENLHNIITKVSESATIVTISSDKLSNLSGQITTTTNEVSSNSSEASNKTVTISSTMNTISEDANGMAGSVNSITSSIDQMSLSLNEVAQNCQKESEIAKTANQKSKEALEMMNKLGEATNQIGKIVGVINDIADQTNLLALNATIEAASAGDAGKGFAVVATEVKELAKQTSLATSEIAGQVDGMQNIAKNSITSIDGISKVIDELNLISQTIVSAVEEQSSTINVIASDVSTVNSTTNNIAKAVSQTATNLSEVSNNVESVNSGIEDTVNGMDLIKGSVVTLKENANELNNVVKKFKI